MEGSSSETMRANMGAASAMLIQKRFDISASSGLTSSPVISRGSSAIPQIGQAPGSERTTSGCMGHVYSARATGRAIVVGSSAMPHFGQLPGPKCLTSGCIGQVYSLEAMPDRFPAGGVLSFGPAYLSGSALNFTAHPWLQKEKLVPLWRTEAVAFEGSIFIPHTGSVTTVPGWLSPFCPLYRAGS